MKKFIYIVTALIVLNSFLLFSRVLYVDRNGGTKYQRIQAAIDDMEKTFSGNDTIVIMPGEYIEQITISMNIVIMGSGASSTLIYGSFSPVVIQKAGILQWVKVTSNSGWGIEMKGGLVQNLVVSECLGAGIYSTDISSKVKNVILNDNKNAGFWGKGEVWNSISIKNDQGFGYYNGAPNCFNCLAYNNRLNYNTSIKQMKCKDNIDPMFDQSTDFGIKKDSPCFDAGGMMTSDDFDPDGSSPDIGYYGGKSAPYKPSMSIPKFYLNPDGILQFILTGKVGY